MVWGVDNWGWEQDLPTESTHLISESITPVDVTFKELDKLISESVSNDTVIHKDATHLISDGITLTDATYKEPDKLISESISGNTDIYKDVDKTVIEILNPDTTIHKDFTHRISETLLPTFEMSSEKLTQGIWDKVFTKPSAEAEDRNLTTFTAVAATSTTWTSSTASAPSWS